jgi:hypothetical protein
MELLADCQREVVLPSAEGSSPLGTIFNAAEFRKVLEERGLTIVPTTPSLATGCLEARLVSELRPAILGNARRDLALIIGILSASALSRGEALCEIARQSKARQ